MNRVKQIAYWANVQAVYTRISEAVLPAIRKSNIKALTAELGLQTPKWTEWQVLLSRARGCLAGQAAKSAKGRRYTEIASSAERLALFMCYGTVDAMTGETLPLSLRSLDA